MKHPDAQELVAYEEGKLDQKLSEPVREHLGTCDRCLDDLQSLLTEKLRADLQRLSNDDDLSPPDALDEEIRRNNDRLADEPAYREKARRMLTRFGMEEAPLGLSSGC